MLKKHKCACVGVCSRDYLAILADGILRNKQIAIIRYIDIVVDFTSMCHKENLKKNNVAFKIVLMNLKDGPCLNFYNNNWDLEFVNMKDIET